VRPADPAPRSERKSTACPVGRIMRQHEQLDDLQRENAALRAEIHALRRLMGPYSTIEIALKMQDRMIERLRGLSTALERISQSCDGLAKDMADEGLRQHVRCEAKASTGQRCVREICHGGTHLASVVVGGLDEISW
jgi:hypothetical protein